MVISDRWEFICLDAEFADSRNNEILELSIYDISGEEIYHQYFKPIKTRKWNNTEKIHHITPAMVKDKPTFKECARDIQSIIDRAGYIIGFATENDIKHLKGSGIRHFTKKHVVNIREWYWLCLGRDKGYDMLNGPGLTVCAGDLGIYFHDDDAHSASNDAKVTLDCFVELARRFEDKYMSGSDNYVTDVVAEFKRVYSEAQAEYHRLNARGRIFLLKSDGGGYRLKRLKIDESPDADVVESITVDDRFRAEYELRRRFLHRLLPDSSAYELNKRDLAYFRSYSNKYVPLRAKHYKRLLQMLVKN